MKVSIDDLSEEEFWLAWNNSPTKGSEIPQQVTLTSVRWSMASEAFIYAAMT